MTLDASFKRLFAELTHAVFYVDDNIVVGILPLQIDLLFKNITAQTYSILRNLGFYPLVYLSQLTNYINWVVEYKSHGDTPTYHALIKLRAYRSLFLLKETSMQDAEIGNLFITVNSIPSILKQVKHVQLQPGIYQIDLIEQIYLIVINELPVIPENFGFLIFSHGKTQQQYLQTLLNNPSGYPHSETFISLIAQYDYEGLRMAAQSQDVQLDLLLKSNRKKIIDAIGKDEVIDTIGKDEVIDAIGKDEVIDTIGKDEVIDTIGKDEVIEILGKDLSPEKRKQLRALFNDS